MANYSTKYRQVSVYVTREERAYTSTNWALYADYPNEYEAREAAIKAIGEGYTHADLRITQRFSQPEV